MSAGKYVHSMVVTKTAAGADDSYGNEKGATATHTTEKASIEPLTGREFFQAAQVNADVTHKIRMHSNSVTRTITPAMWGVWNSRTFQFLFVSDSKERSKEIEILAKESV